MKTLKIFLLAVLFVPFCLRAQVSQPSTSANNVAGSSSFHKKRDSVVRGISFEYFKNSVSDFADTAKRLLADTAWRLWKFEKWGRLEQFFTVDKLNGGWPPARGAISLKIVTLKAGTLIDRYGGYYDVDSAFQDKGTFVSLKGVPFPKRALPDKTLNSPYRVYMIVKPIDSVKEGRIIPWFGKPGLGTQFELPYSVNDLKKGGYLEEEKQ